jgi:uncharacterized membrane protein YdbT with pleckstrin-like domain
MAKYIEELLGRNEQIIFETRVHPIIYLFPLVLIAIGVVAFAVLASEQPQYAEPSNGIVFLILLAPLGLIWLVAAWIRRATTEIAVTTHRIVYKRGLISRNTTEINFKYVESLNIRQPILGRFLDYGTVVIRGTGIGVEPMHNVSKPLQLRKAAFDQEDGSSSLGGLERKA